VNLKPNIQERMLRAFMDIIILQIIGHQSITGYQIDSFIMDKFRTRLSPSVVYAKLCVMEEQDLIKCVHLGHSKSYCLSEKGKELLANKHEIIEEIHSSTLILFEDARK
jgi:DNA-binding PadR family transcriptional regulator